MFGINHPRDLYFLIIFSSRCSLLDSVFRVLLFRVSLFLLLMRFHKLIFRIWCPGLAIPDLVFQVLPFRIWYCWFSVRSFTVPDLVLRHSVFRRSWFYYMLFRCLTVFRIWLRNTCEWLIRKQNLISFNSKFTATGSIIRVILGKLPSLSHTQHFSFQSEWDCY